MKMLPIGIQVYSVRDAAEKDFKGTLQALKEMGYDFLELAGLYGMSFEKARAAVEEAGIPVLSAHVPWDELMREPERTIAGYVSLGCRYIVIPYLSEELRPAAPGFARVVRTIPELGKRCAEKGAVLLYHNHDFEFTRMENGTYVLDLLYQAVPAELLQTELDSCWIKVAGEDPAAYVRKYKGRCPVVHLKDFTLKGPRRELDTLIAWASGAQPQSEDGFFAFRPVGYGMQDIPAILRAAEESGARYLVVEQDYSLEHTPLKAAQMSVEYLREL